MNRAPLDVTLCSALVEGGIAHYSYCLANALQQSGAQVKQLTYDWPEYELRDFPHAHKVVAGLKVAHTYWSRLTSPLHNLEVMLRTAWRSQIVHFQWSLGQRTDRLHLPILRRLGKPVVYTAHDVVPHESYIMTEQHARWLYRFPDALFVHGENLKSLIVERFDVEPARVHVIPHGNYNFISDATGPWNRESARASFGFDADDCVVLFFGLIREYKGIDTLIEACRILVDRGLQNGRKLQLVIAGRVFLDHWNQAGYDAAIRKAGLAAHVHLHLYNVPMGDVQRFFRAADVLAVPYKRGSQSGVLRLAYSFGMATVATRVGSLAEVSGHDITRFVAPEDAAAFAGALDELLCDPELAGAMGMRARQYADVELGWDRIAQTTRAVYADVLSNRRVT